ncbi:MAG TPA: 1-acyl-sn-glycerol-3-phosphate acyltransferase, partial [Nannocystis exedens]|nr:1-acyl-sn-glycerol-3-phosphate acyltransferase [Nannocystis exedens]
SAGKSALGWAASLIGAALGLSAAALVRLVAPATALRIVHRTCELAHRIFGLRVSLRDDNHGRYADPPYVFICLNQTSLIETFLLPWLAPLPYRIIVNLEYALLPVFGWSSVAMGARIVVRQWPKQAKRTIRRAIQDLRQGDTYIISIEGRRSPDGSLQTYKKGAVVMALESEATIIPVVIQGARARLPYGSWRVRPGPVKVHLLPAIKTRGRGYKARNELLSRLRALAKDCLSENQKRPPKPPS